MLEVALRGYRATYTTADGWRCNDQLTENYLRERCTPAKGGGEEAALAAVEREWGDGCQLVDVVDDTLAPTADALVHAPADAPVLLEEEAEPAVAPDGT